MTEDTTPIPVAPLATISAKRAHTHKQIGFVFIFGFLLALAALFAIVFGFKPNTKTSSFRGFQ